MYEWHWSESGDKPDMLDTESSRDYVYIRKDFHEVPSYDMDGQEVGTFWRYQEKILPKAEWEIYKVAMENQSDVSDIQDALCELYEIITGGDA